MILELTEAERKLIRKFRSCPDVPVNEWTIKAQRYSIRTFKSILGRNLLVKTGVNGYYDSRGKLFFLCSYRIKTADELRIDHGWELDL